MAIILPQKPGLGELFGTGFGTGLSEGLQQLAQQKMGQLQQRQQQQQTASGLQALGINQQEAQQISLLPQNIQAEVIKNYMSGAEAAGLDQALGALGLGQPTQDIGLEALGLGQPIQDVGLEALREEPIGIKDIPGPQLPSEVVQQISDRQLPAIPGQELEKKAPSIEAILKQPRISPRDKIAIAKLQQKEKLLEKKQQIKITAEEKKQQIIDRRDAHKETKEYADKINKSYRAAVDSTKRLERINKLNEEGSLGIPVFNTALQALKKGIWGVGLDLTFLMKADAQELSKLSTDFIKNVKDIFGARITDNDIKYFLQTIPTLAQSKDGRTKVIRNLQSFDKAAQIKKKAYNRIVKENDGWRTRDIDMQVDEVTKPLLNELASEFKNQPIGSESKEGWVDWLGKGILWY